MLSTRDSLARWTLSEAERAPSSCYNSPRINGLSETGLTIVIPALNEELAIAHTIERTLAARDAICNLGGIHSVQIVVVNDGSTDRTPAIARAYAGIELVSFPENRGYGAAIKAGWDHAPSELLAFMDADGTCDPQFFVPLCRTLLHGGFDMVLGGRMGPNSKMPIVRQVGNVFFALLLGFLAKKAVRDTASGMRVLRRSALKRLLPLPDGLHFTPAMSAVALMDDSFRIAEIDMPYAERVGRSKLNALRDGLRFLNVILSAAAYLRVSRLTIPIIGALVAAAVALMLTPARYYLALHRLEEWMFYRFALAGLLGTMAVIAVCATIVSEHVAALTLLRYEQFGPRTHGLWRYDTLKILVAIAALFGIVGLILNWPGILQLLDDGHVSIHWSRVVVGVILGINFTLLLATLCTLKIVRALHQRQAFAHSSS